MLGHKLWQIFSPRFETFVTFRSDVEDYSRFDLFDKNRVVDRLAADDVAGFARVLKEIKPNAVVNCIGIVKQHAAAKDPVTSITVNSLFPHRLARECSEAGTRLIHMSTDCVFSGRKGAYTESDQPDAGDLYGSTKLMGEVSDENCLTIRTSMIGRELSGAHGLVEWFLSNEGKRVRGFKRAVFSGFTTLALAEILADIIDRHPRLSGLYHVSSEPTSKFDLLSLIRDVYGVKIEIEPDETFVCDRSLDCTRFGEATGFVAPEWKEMIQRMHDDPTPYQSIRRVNA